MDNPASVLEYKCPCCNAPLIFKENTNQMKCEYCDNAFDLSTVQAYMESIMPEQPDEINWESESKETWNTDEQASLQEYCCNACGGQLVTDAHTAATFCPYCGNPAILPGQLSGGIKPEKLIPFKTTKEDAKQAFLKLCRNKPLLPDFFMEDHQVDKITGIYVPFWIYDCDADITGSYKATRTHTWSDSRYIYTKTDHYLLRRQAKASFSGIPMDGSSKMDDTFMESIEPYDYKDAVDFEMTYLSGFLADRYDVESKSGEARIRQRVETSMNDHIQSSLLGYATAIPTSRNIRIDHSKAKYVLLPVWLLNTKYKDKKYTFAMNGQTGKMTGKFPICAKKSLIWFGGMWAGLTALATLILMVL